MIEPPGLLEEMRGGGSGIERGLTAANRTLSCGRPASKGWPTCWNAGRQKDLINLRAEPRLWFYQQESAAASTMIGDGDNGNKQIRFLTVEMEQVLVVADLGHVSRGHGVGRENRASQA